MPRLRWAAQQSSKAGKTQADQSSLAEFYQKSLEEICENDVRCCLLHQIVNVEAASGTQTVILSGIKFFYRKTCSRQWDIVELTKIKNVQALPEIITQNQVFQSLVPAERFA